MLMQTLRTDSPRELWRTFGALAQILVLTTFALIILGGSQTLGWVRILLLFAGVVLMPLGDRLLRAGDILPEARRIPFIFHLFLANALMLAPGRYPAGFAVCWLLVCAGRALVALMHWRKRRSTRPSDLCLLAAAVFPAIGAAWLVAFCYEWMPFGFDALIVLLTAAHFHHAGFTLPLIAGLIGRECPGRWTSLSCIAVLAGVPLVATGITWTHFGWLPWVEPLAVLVLVSGALGVALSQMKLGFERHGSGWLRAAFVFSGLSLFIAMLLALGFGLRYFMPSLALPMPQMWAVHGSLNAFGFGLLGLLAWRSRAQLIGALKA